MSFSPVKELAATEAALAAVNSSPAVEAYKLHCKALNVKPNSSLLKKGMHELNGARVDLRGNFLGGKGFQAVTEILSTNETMEELIVSGNGLTNDSVVFFARAMTQHPCLRRIDFGGNPISLPAVMGLLELCKKNRGVHDINLSGTNVDELVAKRLQKVLDGNKAYSPAVRAPGILSPFQRAVNEAKTSRSTRHEKHVAVRMRAENAAEDLLKGYIHRKGIRAPQRGEGGWAILNLFVSSTRLDFVTELSAIHNEIVPQLNEKFRSRKVHIVPFSMHHNSARSDAKFTKEKYAHLPDYLDAVERCFPLYVQLIGDKVDAFPLPTGEGDGAGGLQGCVQHAAEHIAAKPGSLTLSFIRQPSHRLNLPTALVGVCCDDPLVAKPNDALLQGQAGTEGDPGVDAQIWSEFVAFRESVRRTAEDGLCTSDYHAVFSNVDANGHVRLTELDGFVKAFVKRVSAVVNDFYPEGSQNETAFTRLTRKKRTVASLLASGTTGGLLGRSSVLGKIDLYTVTPPSRNMLLVTGPNGSGKTAIVSQYVSKLMKKPNYTLAFHFAGAVGAVLEPTDPKTLFIELASQLSPDHSVPLQIQNEVDVERVKDYLAQRLIEASGDVKDNSFIVLAVDGVDALDEIIVPRDSLRYSDTGSDLWRPTNALVTKQQADTPRVKSKARDPFDWIPICLARSVRIVTTANDGSAAHRKLEARGHDSCEAICVGELGDGDVEALVTTAASRFGVSLSEEEMEVLRNKVEAKQPQYLAYALHELRRHAERPQYMSREALVRQLPHTSNELCDRLLAELEKEIGKPQTKLLLSALLCCRWGLPENELRAIVAKQPHAERREMLGGREFQSFARILQPSLTPLLEYEEDGKRFTVGASCVYHLRCRVMREVATTRYFGDAGGSTERATHQSLMHHYQRISTIAGHPHQRLGLKEFPYHMIEAENWALFLEKVATLDHVAASYREGLGYQLMRELLRAYARIEDCTAVADKPSALAKIKEYVYLARDHNTNFLQFPHLVHQIALTFPEDSCVFADAAKHFEKEGHSPHFVLAGSPSAKLHRDAVNGIAFAPTGMRFVTGSDDRTIKVCNLRGETVLQYTQNQTGVKKVVYSHTSRYLVASCEDKTIVVVDATNGALVSRISGHTAFVKGLVMSPRGRFVFSSSDDRFAKVWESETGKLIATQSHVQYAHHTSSFAGVNCLVAHPLDEMRFFTACDKKAFGWVFNTSSDTPEQLLNLSVSADYPVSSLHITQNASRLLTCVKVVLMGGSGEQMSTAPSDEYVKVWSVDSGVNLAKFHSSGPTTFAEVSPCERLVAVALRDGSIQLYHIDLLSTGTINDAPQVVSPSRSLQAFRGLPTPTIKMIRFSFDESLICALGNTRHTKMWTTEAKPDTSKESDGLLSEYLMDHEGLSLDWTPNPSPEGAEIVIGDSVGRVHTLRFVR